MNSSQVKLNQVKSSDLTSSQVKWTQVNSVNSSQVKLTQVNSSQVNIRQVKWSQVNSWSSRNLNKENEDIYSNYYSIYCIQVQRGWQNKVILIVFHCSDDYNQCSRKCIHFYCVVFSNHHSNILKESFASLWSYQRLPDVNEQYPGDECKNSHDCFIIVIYCTFNCAGFYI